jgi:hypothetical protein
MTGFDKAEALGKAAYEAFAPLVGNQTTWDELPSSDKTAWTQSAGAVELEIQQQTKQEYKDVACRCYWIVEAGVVPGIPQPELTKTFALSVGEFEQNDKWELFAKKMVEAIEYARRLHNPNALNWITLNWFWC